jgi:hypothetical protein
LLEYFENYQEQMIFLKKKSFNISYKDALAEIAPFFASLNTLMIEYENATFADFADEFNKIMGGNNDIEDWDYFRQFEQTRQLWRNKYWPNSLFHYLYAYNFFLFQNFSELFFLFKEKNRQLVKNLYRLILTFTNNKIFLNFSPFLFNKNYFFLSSGLFIKYFGKKKSLKKNKIIKILMAKYVRKIFLILGFQNVFLSVKRNPVFLLEFLDALNTPIVHTFYNPLSNKISEDVKRNAPAVRFIYFVFSKNDSFSLLKAKKKGRIKRKITRKLTLKNRIVD